MLKSTKKIIIASVAVLSACAVVGTAYAGWLFNEVDPVVENDATVVVEKSYAATGDITCGNALTLNLDQGTNLTDGISMTRAADEEDGASEKVTSLSATWTVPADNYASVTVSYYVNVFIKTDTLGKYVQITDESAKTSGWDDGTYSKDYSSGYTLYQFAVSAEDVSVSDDEENSSVKLVTISATPTLSYYETTNESGSQIAKPATFADYKAMVTAITSATTVEAGQNYSDYSDSAAANIVVEYVVIASAATSD